MNKWLLVGFMFLILGACVKTTDSVQEKNERRSCLVVCEQQLHTCKQRCEDTCRACERTAVQNTKRLYRQYIEQRCLEGKTIIRRLQSYHDPLQCRKTTCDCPADFRVCAETCYGKIEKRLTLEKGCC